MSQCTDVPPGPPAAWAGSPNGHLHSLHKVGGKPKHFVPTAELPLSDLG